MEDGGDIRRNGLEPERHPRAFLPAHRTLDEDMRRARELAGLASRVDMAQQAADRVGVAAASETEAGPVASSGASPAVDRSRTNGVQKPLPFHAWRCRTRRGWEIYVPDGAVVGPGAEPLLCANCDLEDSVEHKGCRVLRADAPGKYVLRVLRSVVAAGAFPASGWCGTESPSGRLCFRLSPAGALAVDPAEWSVESPEMEVVELGVPAGQKWEGVVWFCPKAFPPKPFDVVDNGFATYVEAGVAFDWGLASEAGFAKTQVENGYTGKMYLAFERVGYVVPPATEPTWGAWHAYATVDDAGRAQCEARQGSTASSAEPYQYAFSTLYTFAGGRVAMDWRQPVCIGGGGGGGSSVPDCRWIDPVAEPVPEE